jgi:hypothetical protein
LPALFTGPSSCSIATIYNFPVYLRPSDKHTTNDRTSVRGEAGEPYDHFGNFATAIAGVNSPDAQMDDNDYAVGLLMDIDKKMGPVAWAPLFLSGMRACRRPVKSEFFRRTPSPVVTPQIPTKANPRPFSQLIFLELLYLKCTHLRALSLTVHPSVS